LLIKNFIKSREKSGPKEKEKKTKIKTLMLNKVKIAPNN
jgi:hypothetical protein